MGGLLLYGALRLLLWLAGIVLALFPALWSLDGSVQRSILTQINLNGHFHDLFFVLSPASALALTTTLDFIWADHTSSRIRSAAIIVLVLNIIILLSGFVGFFLIYNGEVLSEARFLTYSKMIEVGLTISLVSELWLSGASERKRQLLERNWNDEERVRDRLRVLQAQARE